MAVLRKLANALRLLALATVLWLQPTAPLDGLLGAAPAMAADPTSNSNASDLGNTFKNKLCSVYTTGKQLVYIGLGIGILVVVVLSIGSKFRTGLFLTLVASVVIVATTDKLMQFLDAVPPSCTG